MKNYLITMHSLEEASKLVDYLEKNNVRAHFIVDGKRIYARSLLSILSNDLLCKQVILNMEGSVSQFYFPEMTECALS